MFLNLSELYLLFREMHTLPSHIAIRFYIDIALGKHADESFEDEVGEGEGCNSRTFTHGAAPLGASRYFPS